GKVYKVRNAISERIEAMKVLLPNLATNPDLEGRFLREIKTLATLEHPNIAQLRTALRIENQLLMIMEFVDGKSLAQVLQQGPPTLAESVDWVSQVLSALSYAHGMGIIHRDIKPANMMLTPGGLIKLMDFGIAKGAADAKLTMTGQTLGSLSYMSPEQVKAMPLDGRSDIYSLGITFYELVTGKRPFREDSDYALMAAHLQKAPTPPIELDPTLPPTLNEIILMSLAKDPAGRFQTAAAFQNALESVRGSLGPVARPAMPGGVFGLGAGPGLTPDTATVRTTTTPGPPPTALMSGPPAPGSLGTPGGPAWSGASAMMPGVPRPGEGSTMPIAAGTQPGLASGIGAAAPPAPYTPVPTTAGATTAPPQAASFPPTPAGVQPAPTPRSYRGFYMTAGALVAIAVLAIGVTQLPKWYKARAGAGAQAPAQETAAPQQPAPQPAAPAQPSGSGGAPADQGGQAAPAGGQGDQVYGQPNQAGGQPGQPAQPSQAGAAQPAPSEVQPAVESPSAQRPKLVTAPKQSKDAPSEQALRPVRRQKVMGSQQPRPPGFFAPATPPPAEATEAPAAPAPGKAAKMKELHRRLGDMSVRARAVKSSFDRLVQQQAAQGLGPRRDMSAAMDRLTEFLEQARQALAAGDVVEAEEDMDKADMPLDRLEKFLGD
ncbi:MAG TPA: protein kinase, partial [Terriglobia bacterium]|nr:protein kinase [Terriglobia bacterium]